MDSFEYLRSQKEVPAILTYSQSSGKEDTHFVLHFTQVNALRKIKSIYNRPTYIKIDQRLIRTVVSNISMSPGNIFTKRVEFKEYKVGQPNNVIVDVILDKLDTYDQFEKRLNWRYTYVHLICENDKYPGRITLDNKILLKSYKYTFADLNGILPKGLSINTNVHKDLNEPIVQVINFKNKTVIDSISSTEIFEELVWSEQRLEQDLGDQIGKEGFYRSESSETEDPLLSQIDNTKTENDALIYKEKPQINTKSFKKLMKKEAEEFRKKLQEEMEVSISDPKKK